MQKKQTILVVASLLVVVLSVTLAYFTAQIIGKGKNVTINSADLKIIFTDSDGSISGTNIEPGKWNVTKTFTIENKSNETYKYNIVIQDLVNTFVTNGYLQYKITSTNGGYNMTEFKDVPKSSTPKDTILAYSASIDVGVTQSYTVEFKYSNDESVDQSEDMGKTLSGKLFITEGTIDTAVYYAGYEKGTIGYQIMSDNPTRLTRTDFSSVFTEINTGTLYKATESIAGNTPKDVYYFAGDAKNNWVKFGKYQNDLIRYRGYYSTTDTSYKEYSTMDECTSASSYNINCTEYKYANTGDDIYWRIIRTNHDGSIRLLYSGTSHNTTAGYIGTSVFANNKVKSDPMYVGYMYGTSGSLASNRDNTNDSAIKTYIDNWYNNNLSSYSKYISTEAVYCNDRELAPGQTYSTSSNFDYAPSGRLDTNKPTYNCTNNKDAFSGSNSEAKLTYPIGLMTADEIMRAGGRYDTNLPSPYAWYYLNSAGGSITGSTTWWSLSPDDSSDSLFGIPDVWIVSGSDLPGRLGSGFAFTKYGVRPAISLKSCTLWTSGDGSPENPYEIDYDNSNC
jgi:hypothetical protein